MSGPSCSHCGSACITCSLSLLDLSDDWVYVDYATPIHSAEAVATSNGVPAIRASTLPSSTGPVTEDEIRAFLMQETSVTTFDLVRKFKAQLKCKEDKDAFAGILKRISRIRKTDGTNNVVLKSKLKS